MLSLLLFSIAIIALFGSFALLGILIAENRFVARFPGQVRQLPLMLWTKTLASTLQPRVEAPKVKLNAVVGSRFKLV